MSPDEHVGGGCPGNECALHGERHEVISLVEDDKVVFEVFWSSRRSFMGCAAGDDGLGGEGAGEDGAEPILSPPVVLFR
jgi:hypothetical protein